MTDPQTTEAAVDAITGLVNMFKDAGLLYWVITLYSVLIGAAMTYVGRRYFKSLLFLVGAFTIYVPMHYFASEMTSLISAAVAGLIMIFCYPVFVFFVAGILIPALFCAAFNIDLSHVGHAASTCIGATCLIMGILGIVFRKHIVIPVTALSGGWMFALGLAFLFKGIHPILFVLLAILFISSGCFVQYKFTAKGVGETDLPKKAGAEQK